MSDNETIKALEHCDILHRCEGCPRDFDTNGKTSCMKLGEDILALINRQQAEIERLKEANAGLALSLLHDVVNNDPMLRKEITVVAIREFVDRLKREIDMISYETGFEYQETIETIDNLVKEMEKR